jgi:hypothetical protein
MADTQQYSMTRACPVCGVAMVRQTRDDGAIVYQCCSCKTEIEYKSPTSLVSNFSMSLADELKTGSRRFYDLARIATNPSTKLRLIRLAEDYLGQADELSIATPTVES